MQPTARAHAPRRRRLLLKRHAADLAQSAAARLHVREPERGVDVVLNAVVVPVELQQVQRRPPQPPPRYINVLLLAPSHDIQQCAALARGRSATTWICGASNTAAVYSAATPSLINARLQSMLGAKVGAEQGRGRGCCARLLENLAFAGIIQIVAPYARLRQHFNVSGVWILLQVLPCKFAG